MTTGIKNNIKQVNSFIDEAFDEKLTPTYHLAISIGVDHIWLAVNEKSLIESFSPSLTTTIEQPKAKYIAFENFSLSNILDLDQLADSLDLFYKESLLFNHRYGSVACIIVNNSSTIVPSPLFDFSKKALYLGFNIFLQSDKNIEVDDLKNLEAKNIFALPSNLKNKLEELQTNIRFHHFSSLLIEGLLIQNKNQPNKKLFVHVQPSHFEVLVFEGKGLLFYNTFNYFSAEDFLYYLLFVCEQMNLNPENIELIVLGELEKNSDIFTLTQKYIRNIKFGERADESHLSYQLQTLPKHFYFTLFNNYS